MHSPLSCIFGLSNSVISLSNFTIIRTYFLYAYKQKSGHCETHVNFQEFESTVFFELNHTIYADFL